MSGAYSTSNLFTKTTVYLVYSNVGIAKKKTQQHLQLCLLWTQSGAILIRVL